ncbi:hypothetical protein FGB62_14g273 [Gracilaria domingensis]|nr:hypothetical protein FGB62_14g273 [Gracilaria domingensis]
MTILGRRKELVDFVGAVRATLPSPARRCPLNFNPFLDTDRPGCFRPVAYNSPHKFQRVMLEDSRKNFPPDFRFRTNMSITTSGDSTWDFNSMASFSGDVHHAMGGSRMNSSLQIDGGIPGEMKDVKETPCAPLDHDEIRPVVHEDRKSLVVDARPDVSRKSVSAEFTAVQPRLSRQLSTARLAPSESHDRGLVFELPRNTGEEEVEKRERRGDAQEGWQEGAMNVLSSLNFVRKKSPDFRDGRGFIRKLTRNSSGSGTSRNDRVENGVPSPLETGVDGNQDEEGADGNRNLSKTGSLRKLLSLRRGDNDDSPRRNPLRSLLRKTSKTLRTNIFEFGRSAEVDAGRVNNGRGPNHLGGDGGQQAGLRKKYSTSLGNAAMKRGIEEFARVEKRGSTSEPASLSSRTNANEFGGTERESIERYVNEAFRKDIMKHTVNVEKYLDDLAAP